MGKSQEKGVKGYMPTGSNSRDDLGRIAKDMLRNFCEFGARFVSN